MQTKFWQSANFDAGSDVAFIPTKASHQKALRVGSFEKQDKSLIDDPKSPKIVFSPHRSK
jgi:hypothetical protein